MNETSDEVLALSDVDADDGTISPTPATVPKKRGRPANAEKPKKSAASFTGRGRGRPAKGSEVVNKKAANTATSDGSEEEEGTESDDGSPAFNGDSADGEAAVPSKRGRKPKAKRKQPLTVEATGKGRGRPKKVAKTDDGENDEVAEEDDDGASNDQKSGKKSVAKGAKKGRGRPKKIINSDDESSDDKERRPVGRPPSGGINLNIVRTGKGQGRPKKSAAEIRSVESAKKATESETIDGDSPKKRGRPLTSGKGVYLPTGKPRGRPKAVQDNDSENGGGDSNINSSRNESSDEEKGDHANGESVEAS